MASQLHTELRRGARGLAILATVALIAAGCGRRVQKEAADTPQPEAEAAYTTATLTSSAATVVPGATCTLNVRIQLAPQWHTYWKEPGESGAPPDFAWTLPAGWTVGEAQWPEPERFDEDGIMTMGFTNSVTIGFPLHAPAEGVADATADIALGLSWLVCKDICIPYETNLTVSVALAGRNQRL